MYRFSGILIVVAALTFSFPLGTRAQVADRPLSSEEAERTFGAMSTRSGARLYENLCKRLDEFIANKGATDDPLLRNFRTETGAAIVEALVSYCAIGEFVLGELDANRECVRKLPLESNHVQLINHLSFVRSSDVASIQLNCIQTDELISFWNVRTQSIFIVGADIAALRVAGGTISYVLSITKSNIRGGTSIHGTTIGTSLEIAQSEFGSAGGESSGLFLNHLKVERLLVSNTKIKTGPLNLVSANMGDVTIVASEFEKGINGVNGRFQQFGIMESIVENFNCSDCYVAQYLQLASRFNGEVNLSGAQIPGRLLLREEQAAATWSKNARLDLRSARIDTIAADYCDLLIVEDENQKCNGPMLRTLIKGMKFQNIVPGGRASDGKPASLGLLDQPSSMILGWIRHATQGAEERFNPEPYDLMADALIRAGRNAAATDIRIGKLDDDFARGNYSAIKKFIANVARVLTDYGYHSEKSVWAFGVLSFLGVVAFIFGRRDEDMQRQRLLFGRRLGVTWYAIWYSIDRAVPSLVLDSEMGEYKILKPWARGYFYLHRGVGVIIISFFIAGIAGLFK